MRFISLQRRCCHFGLELAIAYSCTIVATVIGAEGSLAKSEARFDGKSSSFLFHYHVTITELPPNRIAALWIPVATSDEHQTVTVRNVALPGPYRTTKDTQFGNSMFFMKVTADENGQIPIAVDYEVRRIEVTPKSGGKLTTYDRKHYLRPNRLVPLGGKPLELLPNRSLVGTSREAVRKIYDLVDGHVHYDKPAGGAWGRGDAVWVCDSRFGNCSDFHSLFISLCRSHGVPARFRIGFPIGPQPKGELGGYHCWAQFAEGDRWLSVDISEADRNPDRKDYYFGRLPPDRVIFSTGRDLILEPEQAFGPVNFFVYPHVEVDGELHSELETDFAFEVVD
ncbi:MAG: transglutaminase domain-containing protein [Alphaproteobacteria bacterium]|nr:transglutaminase domain-containing protein [Alphaproteobacteria bacterium]